MPWEPLSKAERVFIAQLEEALKSGGIGWDGSEDMLRAKFHNFLKFQLVGIMKAAQALRQWTAECKEYDQKSRRKSSKEKKEKKDEYAVMAEEGDEHPRKGS